MRPGRRCGARGSIIENSLNEKLISAFCRIIADELLTGTLYSGVSRPFRTHLDQDFTVDTCAWGTLDRQDGFAGGHLLGSPLSVKIKFRPFWDLSVGH